MQNKVTFVAQPRTVAGKKVKQLRQTGLIPANVMTPQGHSTMITVGQSDFKRLYTKVGDTGLVYLSIDGEKGERPVLVEEVVAHPVTGIPDHVVFRQVNLKEKISAEVPVEIIGEVNVPNSVLITVVNEVTVEALPTDFPDKFEVDVSKLTEIGQTITFADLNFDKSKVTLELGDQDETSPVVILQEVKEEEVAEEPAAAEGEAPAEGATEAAPAEEEAKAE